MRSKCFVAKLPGLTDDARQRVMRWAAAHTAVWKLVPSDAKDGTHLLICMREVARTAKMNCRLLRAGLAKAGVDLPTNKKGWLKLISEGEELDTWLGHPEAKPGPPILNESEERHIDLPSSCAPSRSSAPDISVLTQSAVMRQR